MIAHVAANGLRFAYLATDDGPGERPADRPLALLLHGFPDTAHTWDRVLPALADAGVRAVAPFLRGYHPTEIPGDGAYDADTLGRDVLALIDALGASRAIVIGHDWGAAAAYAAAALDPTRVGLLVTLAIPHPASLRPTPKLLWALRHFASLRRRDAARRLARDDFARVDALVRRWSPTWDVPPGETDRVKAAFRAPGCATAACAYYRAVGARLPASHRTPIAVPTVTFAGTEDPVIAPRAFERARTWFTASYEVVQVPGGHFLHREHPDAFIPELVRLVREHAPAISSRSPR